MRARPRQQQRNNNRSRNSRDADSERHWFCVVHSARRARRHRSIAISVQSAAQPFINAELVPAIRADAQVPANFGRIVGGKLAVEPCD